MSEVLAVSALGDALGVPYEFSRSGLPMGEEPSFANSFSGGAPLGAWSDDTSMALCIAIAASRHDLRTQEGLDAVTTLYKKWADEDGFGIGGQTRTVLERLPKKAHQSAFEAIGIARRLSAAAPDNSAGNGSLMRIHPVALLPYSDEEVVKVARRVTEMTHPDERCVDSSVLWVMMLRHALSTGGDFRPNVGIDFISSDHRDLWNNYILEALASPSHEFGTRGWWVVPSFQQALSAVHKNLALLDKNPLYIFREILACGPCDSDTICAIAGGLMGALGVKVEQFEEGVTAQVQGTWPEALGLVQLQELEDFITTL